MTADPPRAALTDIDLLWQAARKPDLKAFENWMGRVERPIRLSLRRFASAVDAEGVVQETLVRMWMLVRDARGELTGENASLRWALGMARNLAMNEIRKRRRQEVLLEEQGEDEPVSAMETDPLLLQRIRDCVGKLTGQLERVMRMRLDFGHAIPDVQVADMLRMTKNTFLQNVTRARRQIATCLAGFGVDLEETAR